MEFASSITMRPSENFDFNFCSYIIIPPDDMEDTDRLQVNIFDIQASVIFTSQGKDYKWLPNMDQLVKGDTTIDARMKRQVFITGEEKSAKNGSFKVRTWVERGATQNVLVNTQK